MTKAPKITGNGSRITLTAGGKRAGVFVSGPGNWVEGVDPATIKLRFKKAAPAEMVAALRDTYENNSDSREDYFEAGCIRLLPRHGALYDMAKAAAGAA